MNLSKRTSQLGAVSGMLILSQLLWGCTYLREEGWLSPKEQETESIRVDATQRDVGIQQIETVQPRKPVEPIAAPQAKPAVTALHVDDFTGLQPGEVEDLLGVPSRVDMQGPMLIWLYDAGPCSATFQFFKEVETEIYRLLQYDFTGGDEATCLGRIERRKIG